jgi:hypothetical protein
LRRARLAFAKAVRRLQARPSPTADAALPAALLAIQRAPAPAPPTTRRRAVARARAVALLPPRAPSPAFPLAAGAAAVAVGALLVPLLTRPHLPPPAGRASLAAAAMPLGRDGLLGHWGFDDGPGSTVARDRSGRGHDCVLRRLDPATSWIAGPAGGALKFNPRGWLECPALAGQASGAEMTMTAWIRRDARRKFHGVLTSLRRYQGSEDDLIFAVLQDDLVLRSSAWGISLDRPLPVPRDRWVHVAFTHAADGATRMFVDGRAVADARGTLERSLAPTLLLVGAAPGPDVDHVIQHFYGAMDDLRVYGRALDAQEIATLASAAAAR